MDSPASLQSRILRGLAWKGGAQVFMQLSRMAVAIVLARLLTPHDYGLAGMVLVFSALVYVFADMGLGSALVQRRRLTEADRSTAFWMNLAVGLALTCIGIALSGPIASFYGEPEVRPLFAALSLGFVIEALATTQTALLTREMRFRALEIRVIVATAAGGVAGIVAALLGAGAWAIILQQLLIAGVSTVCLWTASSWRPRFQFSTDSVRRLAGYSANVFGTRILFYANRNTDNLLIGRFLGAAPLGIYALSYNVMLLPFSRIATPLQEVLFPAFAELQGDVRRMGEMWLRANRLVATLSVPCLLGLIVVAPDFVDVVLGPKWHGAVRVIQILSWVGLLQSLQRLNSSILQARDRTRTLLGYSVVAYGASLVGFVVGLSWGIVGVATGYAITSTFVEPFYMWLTGRAVSIGPVQILRSLAGVFQAAIVMALAVLLVRAALVDAGVAPAIRLFVSILIGFAVFLPLCLWRAPEVLGEIRRMRSRRTVPVAQPASS